MIAFFIFLVVLFVVVLAGLLQNSPENGPRTEFRLWNLWFSKTESKRFIGLNAGYNYLKFITFTCFYRSFTVMYRLGLTYE